MSSADSSNPSSASRPTAAESACAFLVADDHDLVRCGIRLAVESVPGWTVVAEARDGEEAVLLAQRVRPRVAIIDITMPVRNGVDAIRDIRKVSPATTLIAITGGDLAGVREIAERAGADALHLKTAPVSQLLAIIGGLLGQAARPGDPTPQRAPMAANTPALSDREREVLALVARGRTNREIARQLGISTHTVRTHRMNLMRKVGASSTPDLVLHAIRMQLISWPPQAR